MVVIPYKSLRVSWPDDHDWIPLSIPLGTPLVIPLVSLMKQKDIPVCNPGTPESSLGIGGNVASGRKQFTQNMLSNNIR